MIYMKDEDGKDISFYILEETKFGGYSYILVTDAPEEKDGSCYILKDISKSEEMEAKYIFIEDDIELQSIFNIFTELMKDSGIDMV